MKNRLQRVGRAKVCVPSLTTFLTRPRNAVHRLIRQRSVKSSISSMQADIINAQAAIEELDHQLDRFESTHKGEKRIAYAAYLTGKIGLMERKLHAMDFFHRKLKLAKKYGASIRINWKKTPLDQVNLRLNREKTLAEKIKETNPINLRGEIAELKKSQKTWESLKG